MQKKLDISLIIDNKPYTLTLSKTLLNYFESSDFFDDYPHLYFSPKDQNCEIFTSGAIYVSSTFITMDTNHPIPCFFVGDNQSYPSWGDLQKAIHIIPQKWVIKRNNRLLQYEFNTQSLPFKVSNIDKFEDGSNQSQVLEAIETIKTHIKDDIFAKCVFAMMQKQDCLDEPCIHNFKDFPKSGTKFFYKFSNSTSFMGMSPEWLYTRYKNELKVDAVAGTCLKTSPFELTSQKIIDEFTFVKNDIVESLNPYILEGSFFKEDALLLTGHLAHRFNKFCSLLKEAISDKVLVDLLHPTSAISGYPKLIAKTYIPSFESFERGYYAAPLGYYTKKVAYITVAIRSTLIHNSIAYLFAGAGITKDSESLLEWHELKEKLSLINKYLK